LRRNLKRKPYEGKPYVRFDEGGRRKPASTLPISAWRRANSTPITAQSSSGCYMVEYQNNGLGKVLMNEVLKKYRSVRQKVLLAQNEEYLDHFYTSIGFSDSKLQNCTAYVMQGS
jgi:GNAT superfamily N-acetyltransferase